MDGDLKRCALFVALPFLLSSCAPAGYHYGTWSATNPGQAFQLQPNDACQDHRLISPGALQNMNASVGKLEGFPKPVTSVDAISSNGYGPPLGFDSGPPASVQCYETVTFNDGSQQTGMVDIINETGGLAIMWTPQPPPITPQQSAKETLAAEQFEADTQECTDETNEKMSALSNRSLEAQANGTSFNAQAYIRGTEQASMNCQQAASQQYHRVVGGLP